MSATMIAPAAPAPSSGLRGKPDPNYMRHPGSQWIDDNYSHLETAYQEEWVAANGQGVVAHNSSIDDLVNAIQSMGISPETVAIAFVSSKAL